MIAPAVALFATALLAGAASCGAAWAQPAAPDPLAGYYGNTLVCADASGAESCDIWLGRDGGFVLSGIGQGGHAGRYTVGSPRPDGLVPVCLQLDNAGIDIPPALRVAPVAGEPALLERWHAGLCYPLGPHAVGDRWVVTDDPLPAAGGPNQFVLLPGQR